MAASRLRFSPTSDFTSCRQVGQRRSMLASVTGEGGHPTQQAAPAPAACEERRGRRALRTPIDPRHAASTRTLRLRKSATSQRACSSSAARASVSCCSAAAAAAASSCCATSSCAAKSAAWPASRCCLQAAAARSASSCTRRGVCKCVSAQSGKLQRRACRRCVPPALPAPHPRPPAGQALHAAVAGCCARPQPKPGEPQGPPPAVQ